MLTAFPGYIRPPWKSFYGIYIPPFDIQSYPLWSNPTISDARNICSICNIFRQTIFINCLPTFPGVAKDFFWEPALSIPSGSVPGLCIDINTAGPSPCQGLRHTYKSCLARTIIGCNTGTAVRPARDDILIIFPLALIFHNRTTALHITKGAQSDQPLLSFKVTHGLFFKRHIDLKYRHC